MLINLVVEILSQYAVLCCAQSSVMTDSLRPHGLQPTRLLCPRGFSRQEYWSGLPCPPPGDRMEPRSPTLQVDSLPAELLGKPFTMYMYIKLLFPVFFFNSNFSFLFYLFIYFWPHCMTYGILVPQAGIEPIPLSLEARCLDNWTTEEVSLCVLKHITILLVNYVSIYLKKKVCASSGDSTTSL